MDLHKWAIANEPPNEMFAHGSYWSQIMFMRDRVAFQFAEPEVGKPLAMNVLAEHTSKSVRFPVYEFTLPGGTNIVARNNLSNWIVSVSAQRPVALQAADLFDPHEKQEACYCEGFPENRVFDSYEKNKQQFTVRLTDECTFFVFLWQLTHQR